jgi:hypothetical protein
MRVINFEIYETFPPVLTISGNHENACFMHQ